MNTGAPFIPNCVPNVDQNVVAYVNEAVSDGWLAIGPHIERLERTIAEFTGAKHAVAVSSGTAALHLALLTAGVEDGDAVLIPTLTFAATANAVIYCGGVPIFVDSELDSWGIDPEQLNRFLETDCSMIDGRLAEAETGRRIAAIVPVHLYGHPVDLDPLIALSQRFGIPLVEDGAEALGARYKDRRIGSAHTICALSFNGNKIVTGGNGGMVLTNDGAAADRARYLSAQAKDDPSEFVHGEVGFNYRMPNINAAAALAQAERLAEFVARKREIVARYDEALAGVDGVSMWREAAWAKSSHWMAVLTVEEGRHPDAIARLRDGLLRQGIETRPVWMPLHRQQAYSGSRHLKIDRAERLYRNALCLPCSTGLTDQEHDRVTAVLLECFDVNG